MSCTTRAKVGRTRARPLAAFALNLKSLFVLLMRNVARTLEHWLVPTTSFVRRADRVAAAEALGARVQYGAQESAQVAHPQTEVFSIPLKA